VREGKEGGEGKRRGGKGGLEGPPFRVGIAPPLRVNPVLNSTFM